MDVLIEKARGALRLAVHVAVVIVYIGLVARIPWIRDIDAAINQQRDAAMTATGIFLGASWLAFMSAVIYGLVAGDRRARRGTFAATASFREMKDAARQYRWVVDPHWRCVFFMAIAACAMGTGLFAFLFVIGNAGIKGLLATVYLYAVARTVWGFIIA